MNAKITGENTTVKKVRAVSKTKASTLLITVTKGDSSFFID
jgi:hypothetical protein